MDKKINKKLNSGIQAAIKIVLKKSIKFCDQRMQFLIKEQNDRIENFEIHSDMQLTEFKKKLAAIE